MRREDHLVLSHRPYAVDLSSLRAEPGYDDMPWSWWRVDAVWFRRRKTEDRGVVTAAHIGYLNDIQDPAPKSAQEFLARYTDSLRGGNCLGRWDGQGYWGAQDITVMAQHLAVLRPMLDHFPACPPGFDGWWRF